MRLLLLFQQQMVFLQSNWHFKKASTIHLKNYIQNNANQRLGEI